MSAIRPSVRVVSCHCLWFLFAASSCASFLTASPAGRRIGWAGRVDFESVDGGLAFRVEPSPEGVRVEDGSGNVLLVIRLRDGTLAIENSLGKPLGVVLPPANGDRRFRIMSSDDQAFLFELHLERDGDLELVDENGEIINEAKRRDYGFKISDANGDLVSKVRITEDKISLRDASGTTYLSTRDRLSAESVAAIALEGLKFEYATALSVAIAHWAHPAE